MLISNNLKDRIFKEYEAYQQKDEFRSTEFLMGKLEYFKNKFGPEALDISGRDLLMKIHRPIKPDEEQSLMYWLENKNDDEFPNYFGRITVGSSGDFRVYFSPPDNCWKNKKIQKISEQEAIRIAEENRDILIKASNDCKEMLSDLTYENYERFDLYLEENYPEAAKKQWLHKYLFLNNPDKLADIHSNRYLLHMLLRLQINVKNSKGYYCLDFYIVKLARELNIPIISLTHCLFEMFGTTHEYWNLQLKDSIHKIGVSNLNNYIEYMKDNNVFCLGWSELGDLTHYSHKGKITPFKETLTQKFNEIELITNPNDIKEVVQLYSDFYHKIGYRGWRDIISVFEGNNLLLIGQLEEGAEFTFLEEEPYPHQFKVSWFPSLKQNLIAINEFKGIYFLIDKKKYPRKIIEIEDVVQTTFIESPRREIDSKIKEILSALHRKKQVILYGPPGTGKTYWALKSAEYAVAQKLYKTLYESLSESEKEEVSKYISKCCFHPSYGYEDFIIGYKPKVMNNKLTFELQNGIFKEICEHASQEEFKDRDFFLIIDEINRGDIPRIFGELMMIIEEDKRWEDINIPLSPKKFKIPKNVYIIGTMNTADRSIALLDTALRRRFAFIELMPDYSLFTETLEREDLIISLRIWLLSVNKRIRNVLGKDGRNLQIGHAYLLKNGIPIKNIEGFVTIFKQDIIPLLEEYCYGDYEMLAKILGSKIVNIKNQMINDNLFKLENHDDLFKAIKEEHPEAFIESEIIEAVVNEDGESPDS